MAARRGPVPKRSNEGDRRTQAKKENKPGGISRASHGSKVTIPEPNQEWHPIALMVWKGALESGQSRFYESSDWAVLYSFCDDLTYYKNRSKRSAQMLTALNSMMTSLLLTEADRRRVQIELDRRTDEELESAGVTMLKKFVEEHKRR